MKRNMFFCLVLVACSSRAVTLEDLPFETVVETAGESTPKLVSYGKAAEMVANDAAYPVATNALAAATNALALAEGALQPPATNGLLRVEADTLETVTARGATTTSEVTIGYRGEGAVGAASFANGESVVASEEFSHAEGIVATASAYASHASGFNSVASNITAFAWQGAASYQYSEPPYGSHGPGTFNINPVGGLSGFWIGETPLSATLSGYATTGAVAAVQAEVAGKADAEVVVAGTVGVATAGNRYFWTSATNVVLSVNLASGQVVNLAKLNNTGATSITAIGAVGWEWTGGDMTNTIPAGKSMTFGFLVDAATGVTNAYATGVSK